MKYSQFLLDADETIFDFVAAARKSFRYTLERFSLPYSEKNFLLFKEINDGVWREYERGELTKAQLRILRFERFFAEIGADGDAENVDRLYFDTLCSAGDLLEGAREFLSELKRRGRIYLVTNGTAAAQRGRIRVSGVGPFLDGVFISDELGAAKPDKTFFDAVLAAIGKSDKECLVIGDSLSSDIAGANRAGIDSVWFNPRGKKQEGEALASYTAKSYAEILKIIDES